MCMCARNLYLRVQDVPKKARSLVARARLSPSVIRDGRTDEAWTTIHTRALLSRLEYTCITGYVSQDMRVCFARNAMHLRHSAYAYYIYHLLFTTLHSFFLSLSLSSYLALRFSSFFQNFTVETISRSRLSHRDRFLGILTIAEHGEVGLYIRDGSREKLFKR